MAPRIPAGYGQFTEVLTLDGDAEPMVITIGVGPNITDDAAALDWVAALHGQFGSNVMPETPNDYHAIRGELRYHVAGDADDDPLRVAVNSTVYNGTHTSEPAPQNCAYLVHKRTAVGGRQGRGRLYMPGVLEAQVSPAGVISTGQISAITNAFNGWRADVEANPLTSPESGFYLLHNLANGELLADLPTRITSFDCDSLMATQRRRLRR